MNNEIFLDKKAVEEVKKIVGGGSGSGAQVLYQSKPLRINWQSLVDFLKTQGIDTKNTVAETNMDIYLPLMFQSYGSWIYSDRLDFRGDDYTFYTPKTGVSISMRLYEDDGSYPPYISVNSNSYYYTGDLFNISLDNDSVIEDAILSLPDTLEPSSAVEDYAYLVMPYFDVTQVEE